MEIRWASRARERSPGLDICSGLGSMGYYDINNNNINVNNNNDNMNNSMQIIQLTLILILMLMLTFILLFRIHNVNANTNANTKAKANIHCIATVFPVDFMFVLFLSALVFFVLCC